MELEKLKETWGEKTDDIRYSPRELEGIFETRTKRTIRRINTNMLWDALLMIVATGGFITLSFLLGLRNRYMISAELVSIATILIIHYRIKYLTLNKPNFEANGISKAVTLLVKKLKQYIALYKALVPMIAGGLFLLYQTNLHYYKYGTYTLEALSWKNTGIAMGIVLAVYFLSHLITKLMYGKELGQLEKLSSELKKMSRP